MAIRGHYPLTDRVRIKSLVDVDPTPCSALHVRVLKLIHHAHRKILIHLTSLKYRIKPQGFTIEKCADCSSFTIVLCLTLNNN